MPDNKDLRDERDRSRIAEDEDWEIEYMVAKTGATREEIAQAIKAVGNDRAKVEEFLKNRSKK